MSYILDALRKADAQRERDASRGIHAQAVPAPERNAVNSGQGRAGWIAAVAVVGVVAIAAVAYSLRKEPAPAPVTASAPPPVTAPPPAATSISPPAPPPLPQPAPMPAPAPAAAPEAPMVAGGLPPDAPRIAISGGVYSPNPAQRMLIVNGQVYNEGSEVAPGVKIEAIQARTAVLGFRGTRYTVAY